MFYDMHLHTTSSVGENSVEEMAAMAKRLGLSGIVVVSYYPFFAELPKIEGIDLVNAVMLKPSTPNELQKMISKSRSKAELILVHGGLYEVNRAACETSAVDILCHPEFGRKDSGLDHVTAKAAAENKVAIEINFRQILESHARNRVNSLASMRTNVMLCSKYNATAIATSGAVNKWGMRSGRELASMLNMLGMDLGASIDALSEAPFRMIKENREKLSGKRWEGVVQE